MKYNHTVVQDGQTYQPGEEVPDMGTIVAFETSGNLRKYIGLSKDVDKLPKYTNLASGSSCLMVDTSAVYVYEKSTQEWYQVGV